MKLFTVGYEGCDIDKFPKFLRSKHVARVVDVRKNPISRKKGFSKTRLSEALGKQKIEYLHMPALGVPREWRQKNKAGLITRKKMFSDYVKKILPEAQNELAEVLGMVGSNRLALLCYEADASDCHRQFVALALKKMSKGALQIDNLRLQQPLTAQRPAG
jgi:uncharacterized protein (DUF488 family)